MVFEQQTFVIHYANKSNRNSAHLQRAAGHKLKTMLVRSEQHQRIGFLFYGALLLSFSCVAVYALAWERHQNMLSLCFLIASVQLQRHKWIFLFSALKIRTLFLQQHRCNDWTMQLLRKSKRTHQRNLMWLSLISVTRGHNQKDILLLLKIY